MCNWNRCGRIDPGCCRTGPRSWPAVLKSLGWRRAVAPARHTADVGDDELADASCSCGRGEAVRGPLHAHACDVFLAWSYRRASLLSENRRLRGELERLTAQMGEALNEARAAARELFAVANGSFLQVGAWRERWPWLDETPALSDEQLRSAGLTPSPHYAGRWEDTGEQSTAALLTCAQAEAIARGRLRL